MGEITYVCRTQGLKRLGNRKRSWGSGDVGRERGDKCQNEGLESELHFGDGLNFG